MPRPTKFNADRFALILAEKRIGQSDRAAAKAAGVSDWTLYAWLRAMPSLREAFEAARKEGAQKNRNDLLEKANAFCIPERALA